VRFGLLAPLLLALACNDTATDRREWRPSDHDHTDNPSEGQVVGSPDGGSPELARHGLNEVSIMAWQQNCVRCHGRLGRGDGPQGPMTRATDLGNPDFQRTVSDEQMMKSLKEGKGLMPAFPLPEQTLKSLIQLVRLVGKATLETEAAAGGTPAGSGAPARSAAPPGSVRAAPGRPGASAAPVVAPPGIFAPASAKAPAAPVATTPTPPVTP
jgi:cytochrome c oxidase cbb3-type subunit 3